jgi:YggT family protein
MGAHREKDFPVIAVLLFLLTVTWFVLVARVLVDFAVSVVPVGSGAHLPVARARAGLHRVTEPVLAPLRRRLPPVRVGPVAVDLSILVIFLAIMVLRALLGG